MSKYYDVLKTAIDRLERNGLEQRRTVYLNARNALIRELRANSPPLVPAEISRYRLELEQAIRKIERELAGNAAPAQGAAGSEEPSVSSDTASVPEKADRPAVEIEPAPEDELRAVIDALENGGKISTSVAATPPQDETVRAQLHEDTSGTAGSGQPRVDDENAVLGQPPLVPIDSDLTKKTASDQPEPRNTADKK